MQYACYISENIQGKFQNYHSHKVITNMNKEEREHFFKDKMGKNHSHIYQPFSHFFKQKINIFFQIIYYLSGKGWGLKRLFQCVIWLQLNLTFQISRENPYYSL